MASNKRVLILKQQIDGSEQYRAFTSAKVLVDATGLVNYGTLMNHFSRTDEPYRKKDFEIHRLDLVKPGT